MSVHDVQRNANAGVEPTRRHRDRETIAGASRERKRRQPQDGGFDVVIRGDLGSYADDLVAGLPQALAQRIDAAHDAVDDGMVNLGEKTDFYRVLTLVRVLGTQRCPLSI